jgi:hypothetical protein
MTPLEDEQLSQKLAQALTKVSRDRALDALRAAFLEDEMAIPEISFDFGLGGYDDLSYEALREALRREPAVKLRRLAKLLGVEA